MFYLKRFIIYLFILINISGCSSYDETENLEDTIEEYKEESVEKKAYIPKKTGYEKCKSDCYEAEEDRYATNTCICFCHDEYPDDWLDEQNDY